MEITTFERMVTNVLWMYLLFWAIIAQNHEVMGFTVGGKRIQQHTDRSYLGGRLLSSSSRKQSARQNFDDGQVGKGPNWIERSFPVADGSELDATTIHDWNVGIDGQRYV